METVTGKVNALSLVAIGDLRLEKRYVPSPLEDEVLLKVGACGICQSDIPRVYIKGTYKFPTVVGHEFAGTVVGVGDNNDANLIGKRFVVFPLLPCRECDPCKRGSYATCTNYDYYGSRRDGGMQEFLAVKKWNLVPIPDSLDFVVASMCEPTAVAIHAVKKANVKPGQTVGVFGAGTIGTIVATYLKSRGLRVVLLARNDDARCYLKERGYDARSLDDDSKYDVCFELANGMLFQTCLSKANPGGKVLCMGNPVKDVPLTQDQYWSILRKELDVVGTWNSSFNDEENDWVEAVNFLTREDLGFLVTARYPLENGVAAFEHAKDRLGVSFKTVVELS